jgi:hypothetical protein
LHVKTQPGLHSETLFEKITKIKQIKIKQNTPHPQHKHTDLGICVEVLAALGLRKNSSSPVVSLCKHIRAGGL